MRLNGWQRIGAVLSIAWALGGYVAWIQHENADWGRSYSFSAKACESAHPKGDVDCPAEAAAYAETANPDRPVNAAIFALLPIPFVWLLVYGALGLYRWIGRGFEPKADLPILKVERRP